MSETFSTKTRCRTENGKTFINAVGLKTEIMIIAHWRLNFLSVSDTSDRDTIPYFFDFSSHKDAIFWSFFFSFLQLHSQILMNPYFSGSNCISLMLQVKLVTQLYRVVSLGVTSCCRDSTVLKNKHHMFCCRDNIYVLTDAESKDISYN